MKTRIHVTLTLILKKYAPDKENAFYMEIDFPGVVLDVINNLEIPPEVPLLITLNGQQAFLDTSLHPGDNLKLFPMLAGG